MKVKNEQINHRHCNKCGDVMPVLLHDTFGANIKKIYICQCEGIINVDAYSKNGEILKNIVIEIGKIIEGNKD